ncbi:cytochrome P450 [Candidatus Nitrosoglobus terrae]|uniref:Cytochrome P450 n=1 Tax=Candidatus Nitrosoglobus terrae TaxID=1630141 RepID=A0A1Q2SL47_9GAMM|nr:cytochrome P450 [Candidatus Nitrosoglobus terrae]BAW79866.1 cytochrome P450 [Candidatus Nitrosoglobus terrae]
MDFEDSSKFSIQLLSTLPSTSAMDIPTLSVKDMEEMKTDPHSVYRKYRNMYPVVFNEKGSYAVLRHADVQCLSKDPRLCAIETIYPEMFGVTSGALFSFFEQGMLTTNGESHRRRRSPFTKLSLRQTVEDMRPVVRQTANDLIDSWYENGQVEFIEGFSAQLPSCIIGDFLGLPRADTSYFSKLTHEMGKFLNIGVSSDEVSNAKSAASDLKDYIEQKIIERRKNPRDDYLSVFLKANDESSQLSQLEFVFQIMVLIIGGTDTTRTTIAITIALLLQYPEQWKAVCQDPRLIPNAVAESMRYEPVVSAIARKTLEVINIDGAIIPANALVSLSTMSAMRDKQVYDRPDIFDIYREKRDRVHPIFGAGVHRCLGEALARIELEEALAVFSVRIPHVQLNYQPMISGNTGALRRIDSMELSWSNQNSL